MDELETKMIHAGDISVLDNNHYIKISEVESLIKQRDEEVKEYLIKAIELANWYVAHSQSLYHSIDPTNKKHIDDLTKIFNERWKLIVTKLKTISE